MNIDTTRLHSEKARRKYRKKITLLRTDNREALSGKNSIRLFLYTRCFLKPLDGLWNFAERIRQSARERRYMGGR